MGSYHILLAMQELTGNVLHRKELLDKRTRFGKDIVRKTKGMKTEYASPFDFDMHPV